MTVEDWLGKDNQLGIDIWTKKYQYNNESFDEWLDRVSGNDDNIKRLIKEKKFLFGGRILAGRGLSSEGKKMSLSNCYYIKAPEDNLESIYDTVYKLAKTYSRGGGCGTDISGLSPKGAIVNNAAGTTSGAVSFMDTFSQVTKQIGIAGRRGALMLTIDCHHPDLEDFIDVKKDLNKVTSANISIKITDDFIEAVKSNKDFTLSFTRKETGETIKKTVNARKLFKKIAQNNWEMGEPGCLFWDNVNNYNLMSEDDSFHYGGVNPCGEECLPDFGSCLLGSLNLSEFVVNGKFDFKSFEEAVFIAVNGLNSVLLEGLPLHPLQEQRDCVNNLRQIGLGVFGIADMLIKLKLKYGSEESIKICDEIGKCLAKTSIVSSCQLTKTYGAFPLCKIDKIRESEFFKNHIEDEVINGLANSQLLTIAPTGTLSTMLGVSGGIEPIFANSYTRKTQSLYGEDVFYKVYTPIVDEYMKKNKIDDESKLPSYFVTAENIDYKDRINMQACWQKHIDASISSTINLPETSTPEDIYNLYLYAHDMKLKGVTVFRSNCNRAAVLSTDSKSSTKKSEKQEETEISTPTLARGEIIECSDKLIGLKRKLTTGCGSLHVQCYFDPETRDLQEVYVERGSKGGCTISLASISRLISMSCRAGVSANAIVDQLQSSGACCSYTNRTATKGDTSKGTSCSSAIGFAILDMQKEFKSMQKLNEKNAAFVEKVKTKEEKEKIKKEKEIQDLIDKGICPSCHEPLIHNGGCVECQNCGWSKCG